jgi:hypothetical protein
LVMFRITFGDKPCKGDLNAVSTRCADGVVFGSVVSARTVRDPGVVTGFLAVDLGVEGAAFDFGVLGVPSFKLVILCSGLTGAKLYSANIASYLLASHLQGEAEHTYWLFHLIRSIMRCLRR